MNSSNVETAPHPAEQYIDNVISGRQIACRYVRLACERHRRDLDHAHERGLYFDPDAAQHIIDFFSFLRHSKGEWMGTIIELEPWQQALLWILFGWQRADGKRRFRTTYWECARKQGKSTIAAGVGLYMMVADGEPGAEVYAAATKRAQAKMVFDEATRMVKKSPSLRKRIRCFRDNLHIKDTATKFEPLGRDADTMDGLNVHCGIVDELHAHRSDEVWGVLRTATGARRQPLMFAITTAGFNQASFCYRQREYAIKVLDDVIQDDSFFAIIYTLDEEDDWKDESTWIKANPNLGVSIYLEDMRDQARAAREMASDLANFLTKRLNIWTTAAKRWIHPDKWKACNASIDVAALAGRKCFGGLDLSNRLDLTAFALVFPPLPGEKLYQVLVWFWVPEEAIRERSRKDSVPYDVWAEQGYIEKTPGEIVDYDYIYRRVEEVAGQFDIQEIAFDAWGATQVYAELAKRGMTMVEFRQGYKSMSPPMKDLEALIVSKRLAHGNNPVLTWNAHNLVATKDPAGNLKPDKDKSSEKIDGMVALIMGLARAEVNQPEEPLTDDDWAVKWL